MPVLRVAHVLVMLITLGLSLSAYSPVSVPPDEQKPKVLEINQATAQEFAALPGIGPKLAKRIVEFREKHGPYRRIEDLLVVRGMGTKKWKAIRPYLTVGNQKDEE